MAGTRITAFQGSKKLASGRLLDVASALRERQEAPDSALILIFADDSGRQLDLDLSGSPADFARRFAPPETVDPAPGSNPPRRGRGRPKLGVVGREVTLLPRHWEWLRSQRGGPSATLRRLVDGARAENVERDRAREAQDAINRFISALAGNFPGFEEANRALYRGDLSRFRDEVASWPPDIRSYIEGWVPAAFLDEGSRAG